MTELTVRGAIEQIETALDAARTLASEQIDDHVTFRGVIADLKALVNAVQATFKDGLLAVGTLLITAATEKFKTTTTAYFRIGSIQYSKAAADNLVFSGTSTINNAQAAGTGHWGVFLVQISAAGTITTKHGTYTSGTDQDYATEAAAIAALPAADAGNVALGYITVQVKTGGNKWIEATDDLTPTSDCTTAHFVDGTPLTAFTAAAVSSSGPDALTATLQPAGPGTLSPNTGRDPYQVA